MRSLCVDQPSFVQAVVCRWNMVLACSRVAVIYPLHCAMAQAMEIKAFKVFESTKSKHAFFDQTR